MPSNSLIDTLQNARNFHVFGAGISGISAARLLSARGYSVTLSNDMPLSKDQEEMLVSSRIVLTIGPQTPALFQPNLPDCVVVSPGISLDHPSLLFVHSLGVPLISEIDLAFYFGRSPFVIGITGTNGKSTTTTMIAHVLKKMGFSAQACGNIGVPPTQLILQNDHSTYWAMELSSYQIEGSHLLDCDAVVFTSFTPDHLQRHRTIENYFAAKWRLCEMAKKNAPFVFAPDVYDFMEKHDPDLLRKFNHQFIPIVGASCDFKSLGIATKHDQLNASMAVSCILSLIKQKKEDELFTHFKDFRALPFRYNIVGYNDSFAVINDSKSTNVDSTITALKNQNSESPCLLLVGGLGKGESFTPILSYLNVISEIWCFGKSGPQIYQDLGEHQNKCRLFSTLEEALRNLKDDMLKNRRIILFSPGCASFDEFKNFEARGKFFNDTIVGQLTPIAHH